MTDCPRDTPKHLDNAFAKRKSYTEPKRPNKKRYSSLPESVRSLAVVLS